MSDPLRELLLLQDPPGRASWNMALDESLLEVPHSSWLRFYTWEPHAISLGYFQKLEDFRRETAEFDLVRRPTGGGAILHAHELTFSLALPESVLPGTVRASYQRINQCLMEALESLGVRLIEPKGPDSAAGDWCFAHPVGLDLVQEDGRKVVGCAQRRRRGRVLHHGSLILARHPWTDFTGSLEESGLEDAGHLPDRISERLAEALGFRLKPVAGPPDRVLARARVLEQQRYASEAWTARR